MRSSIVNEPCNTCDPNLRDIDFDKNEIPRSSSIGKQMNEDIFIIPEGEQYDETENPFFQPKFLVLPSFLAGVCLGTNNFFLGFISNLGLKAAFEFSLGAFIVTLFIKVFLAFKSK